jgi:hypothetical protein
MSFKAVSSALLILFLLAGCQAAPATQPPPSATLLALPISTTRPTRLPTRAPRATVTPTPTGLPNQGAVQTARDYFAALQREDFSAAAEQVSAFCLAFNQMTAGDLADELGRQKAQGAAWSGLQVVDSQVFDEKTVLIHVTYRLAGKDARTGAETHTEQDELWPVRLENGQWRYNWSNVIDFKALRATPQLAEGLIVTPLQISRYSDKIRLRVLAQNTTAEDINIGLPNQVLATFHFGDQSVDAVNKHYFFNPYYSDENVYIDALGLFARYPQSVDILKYKTYITTPWYTFNLGG